jgi:serine protease Do
VDGKSVADELRIFKPLKQFSAGYTTEMLIERNRKRMVKEITLNYPPQKLTEHMSDHFAGGNSNRKDGFTNVFAHDARIMPDECGGPVPNAADGFLGINIARPGRTSTIAIPAELSRIL